MIHPARPSVSLVLAGVLAGLGSFGPTTLDAQRLDATTLPTKAEATDFIETSRYADVVGFLEAVASRSDRIHLTTMGFTQEGRAIPMAVVGDVADASPEAVLASGRLRVYLQGNIHGGEVPGKEALQMLLRGIAAGDYPDWSDRLVLLVAPIYNADGNERVALTNRPRQHGPIGGMGQRPNAQGYDLNRDHMKLDSPEARSVVRMMTDYDPHLSVDLHTTNGSRHAYHVTYSPPLHPGTHDALIDLLRNEMLPAITETIREEHGAHFYYYGNVQGGGGGRGGRGGRGGAAGRGGGEQRWVTFDHRPRFNNNYIGLRNRLAILSEAYSYLSFRDRVFSTLWFVEEIVRYAHANDDALASAVETADESIVGMELPTRATAERAASPTTILMGEVDEERHPLTGQIILLRRDVETPVEMWEYGTFEATDSEVAPARYLVPPELAGVLDRLQTHGVRVTTTTAEQTMTVEEFVMDSVRTAAQPFQGHQERTLFGSWNEVRRSIPAGTASVDVTQPLGRLAFYLLEPRSDDGFANWGLLDDALDGEAYPILRVR